MAKKEKEIKLRIGIFSDLHFSVDSQSAEHKWFPAIYDLLARYSQRCAQSFLDFWDRLTCFWAAVSLTRLAQKGPFDFFVNCGDTTPGTDEEGMRSEKAIWQARRAEELIRGHVGDGVIYTAPGNHDLGYFSTIPGARCKGPSDESAQNYEELFGPLWQTTVVKGIRLVFLYSYLLFRLEADFSEHPELLSRKRDQERWLREELPKTVEPLLIFLHDPTILPRIFCHLEPVRGRIIQVVAGHVHSRFLGWILKWRYREWQRLPLQIVPAPWGWCGLGRKGGSLILTIYGDNTVKTTNL